MKKHLFFLVCCALFFSCAAQKQQPNFSSKIEPGAHATAEYLPLLKGRRVAVFANHTSLVGEKHLIDVLRENNVQLQKVFAPEHGFRGTADAGEKIASGIDAQSGIRVVSLYGAKRKPSADDLKDVDILIFDIQDVGVRFYTYISSLQDFMEAALEFNKPLLIFDRPNPNGFYVDGPVLQPSFKSFVGMQPIPVVYGMTMGEYAQMLLGEKWLSDAANQQYAVTGKGAVTIIKVKNYTHADKYKLPVKPSPNLPDMSAVYRYPSTCFFEGTVMSEGRGTEHPFEIFGHPSLPSNLYAFTPKPREGALSAKFLNTTCYGWNIHIPEEVAAQQHPGKIELSWLLQAYALFDKKDSFFIAPKKQKPSPQDYFFNKLAGNDSLMQQMKRGLSEKAIRQSWQADLASFKKIRSKYLLYKDFE